MTNLDAVKAAHAEALDYQQKQLEATDRRTQLIREEMATGTAATEIAAALGVNRQRVYQMAKLGAPDING